MLENNQKKLNIYVTSGVGEGSTNISAFDTALMKAGIANYNLIYLSSIIPEGSVVKAVKLKSNGEKYGNKLYVVIARSDQATIGKEAWAGLGWTQDETGRGLFAEHWAESKEAVVGLINNSLKDMRESRPYKYGNIKYSVTGIKCKEKPVCAVVAAVYKAEGWNS